MDPFVFREMYRNDPVTNSLPPTLLVKLREYWELVPCYSVTDTINAVCNDFASTSGERAIRAIELGNVYVLSLCIQYGANIDELEWLKAAACCCRLMMVHMILKRFYITRNKCKRAIVELILSNVNCHKEVKMSIYRMLTEKVEITAGHLNYIITQSNKRDVNKDDPVYLYVNELKRTVVYR